MSRIKAAMFHEFGGVVHKVFDLKDAGKAQQEMLDRKNFGKIVLKVS